MRCFVFEELTATSRLPRRLHSGLGFRSQATGTRVPARRADLDIARPVGWIRSAATSGRRIESTARLRSARVRRAFELRGRCSAPSDDQCMARTNRTRKLCCCVRKRCARQHVSCDMHCSRAPTFWPSAAMCAPRSRETRAALAAISCSDAGFSQSPRRVRPCHVYVIRTASAAAARERRLFQRPSALVRLELQCAPCLWSPWFSCRSWPA